jgi:hypothetical protein
VRSSFAGGKVSVESGQIERVQHPVWSYPTFARHDDAPLGKIDLGR